MDHSPDGDFRWEDLSEEEKREMRAKMHARLTEPDLAAANSVLTQAPPEQLSEEDRQIRLTMATNPNTPAPVLHQLACCGVLSVMERVAENQRTHPTTLTALAAHHDVDVRSAVAENSNTPLPVLKSLAADENPDVRYRLAENHNTPLELLELLSEDHNPYVSCRAQRTVARLRDDSQSKGTPLTELDPLRQNAGGV